MLLLRKLLIFVFISSFIIFTNLFAHGGSEGSENDWLAQMLFAPRATSEGFGFESVSQSDIYGDTLDINDIDPLTTKQIKDQIRRDLENGRDWSQIEANIFTFIGDAANAGATISKITVVTAAILTAILAAHPEILAAEAEALSAGQQLAWTISYTGATSTAQNTTEMLINDKSLKDATKDLARAMVQSAVIGSTMPNNPVTSNIVDAALSEVDISSKTPTHLDGLRDYGPGHTTTVTGQRLMR